MDKLLILSVLATWLGYVQPATIRQLIEARTDLSELKNYFKDLNSDHYRTLNSASRTFTFFAPNNEAFARMPAELKSRLQSPSQKRRLFNTLMDYHTVDYNPINPDMGLMSSEFKERPRKMASMGGSKLFYLKHRERYYVNDAHVVEPDIQASNGVLHILDAVLSPVAVQQSLFAYIEDPKNTVFTEFLKMLESYDQSVGLAVSCLSNDDRSSTLFAPTDEAFARIPNGVIIQLRNSPNELRKVVDSHVICDEVYPKTLINETAPAPLEGALEGQLEPSRYGFDLYIRNDCVQGRMSGSSIITSSGILHPVNTVLGFRHNSLLDEIESRNNLRRFYGHIQSSNVVRGELLWEGLPGTRVPQDQVYTIFVPTNDGMHNSDLTQRNLDNILHYHMVRGMYTMQDMLNNVQKTTMGYGEFSSSLVPLKVSTRTDPDTGILETFVEVNYVFAKVLLGDICVKNGLLHIIDNVLGVPIQQSMKFMYNQPELSEYTRKINSLRLDGDINNKPLTIFAPTNRAFERMRQTNIGTQLLDSENMAQFRNVMLRHMVRGNGIILTDNAVPKNLKSEFDQIAVKKVGSQYYVTFNRDQDVLITRLNMRTRNAVIHIVDEVMFVDDVRALEVTGRCSNRTASLPLIVLLLLVIHQSLR